MIESAGTTLSSLFQTNGARCFHYWAKSQNDETRFNNLVGKFNENWSKIATEVLTNKNRQSWNHSTPAPSLVELLETELKHFFDGEEAMNLLMQKTKAQKFFKRV